MDVSRREKLWCVLMVPLLVNIRKTCQNRSVPNTAGVFLSATHGHFTTLAMATAIPMLLQTALNEMRDGGIMQVGAVPAVGLLRVTKYLSFKRQVKLKENFRDLTMTSP